MHANMCTTYDKIKTLKFKKMIIFHFFTSFINVKKNVYLKKLYSKRMKYIIYLVKKKIIIS